MQRVGRDEVSLRGTTIAAMILRLGRYLRTAELSIPHRTVVKWAYMIPLKTRPAISSVFLLAGNHLKLSVSQILLTCAISADGKQAGLRHTKTTPVIV
jgi:hypothetical protein